MSYEVHPIRYSDALFADLIAVAANDGHFVLRLRDHWLDGSEQFNRAGELLLGAFAGDRLVGVGGISLDPYEPEDGLARVRHVYVLAAHRRKGIARTLMAQLIEHARHHFRI